MKKTGYYRYLLFFLCLGTLLPMQLSATLSSLDSCLIQLKKNNQDTLSFPFCQLLTKTGECYAKKEYFVVASTYYQRALKIAKLEDFAALKLKNNINLGVAYFWTSEYNRAVNHLQAALEAPSSVATSKDSAGIYLTLGNTYYYMGKRNLSYQNTLKALEINPDKSDPKVIADSYYALALIDVDQGKYEKGMEKIKKALSLYESLKNLRDQAFSYDVIGRIYHETKQYELAIKYKVLSCEIDEDEEYEQYYVAYCAHDLGTTYEAMGNYQRAMELYQEALSIQEASNQYGEKIETEASIGKLYSRMGQCKKGQSILMRSLIAIKKLKNGPILKEVYLNLFEANQVCGNYQQAIGFLQTYHTLSDSLMNESNMNEVNSLSATNELQQKQQELMLLQRDKKLQTLYSYLMGGVIFLLFLFVFIGYWTLKKQKKQNLLLATKSNTIKQQNEQLVNTNKELASANGELNQFAYIVSHDLKAPLRGISTLAAFIEEDLKEEQTPQMKEEIIGNLQLVKGRIVRMSDLIQGILEYSRSGRITKEKEPVKLSELVPQIIQLLATPAHVQIKIAVNLPTVHTAKVAMQQVFQNLLSNAIKYNDKTICQIEIGCIEFTNYFQFSVKDNGPGIPTKHFKKVFQIFQTLQPRDKIESTGVGLAIVEKVVKDQGKGTIWIESTESKGATFIFNWQK